MLKKIIIKLNKVPIVAIVFPPLGILLIYKYLIEKYIKKGE
jgi:hypothetical protein